MRGLASPPRCVSTELTCSRRARTLSQIRQGDDEGLHVLSGKEKTPQVLPVDTVVVCAGQESEASLEVPLREGGLPVFKIGGAHLAAELDAKRAIDQASRLAAAIEEARPEKVGDFVAPLTNAAWLFQKIAPKRA